MEETQPNVQEEILQEVVQPEQTNELSQESQEPSNNDKEINFKKLRDTKDQLEKENRELRSKLNQEAHAPKQEVDDFGIDDDDIVDGKTLKKLNKELVQLRNEVIRQKQEAIPDRLKAKFPDLEQVVTKENMEKLKQLEPEVYDTIISGNDMYTKGVTAYKTLKGLGIVSSDNYKESKEQVLKNVNKPMSAQSVNKGSALSQANMFAKGLTPELKEHLRKEMAEAIRAH